MQVKVQGRIPQSSVPQAGQVADTVAALQHQVARLQQALLSHAPIDQATGILIALGRLMPEEAWDVLRETSMNTNIKLRELAELVITGARAGSFDDRITGALVARMPHTPRRPGGV
ncbi:ANTAR domain-containing protein [Streptomyces fuscigenes]|uniref:ANTAR domain-containing protein n=1 Tax=Streptomyces fuscigenes TaxID=1528880 RepID=UPI001F27A7BA|nr:ANTAR domain-containing protein [Streptomyces fuscigenes]MCF3960132.1 ANTAR domain-containing protein [Streptomyces fuscigenes]